MFDDMDEICDTINALEGKPPVREAAESTRASSAASVKEVAEPMCASSAASVKEAAEPTRASSTASAVVERPEREELRAAVVLGASSAAGALMSEEAEVEAVASAPGMVLAKVMPSLTLEQVLSLQKELQERFASSEFQSRLRALEEVHGKGYEGLGGEEERAALFLTVHREVLPEYGFAGTQAGILDMLQAAAVHNSNAEFCENRERLNQLLGLSPTAEELAAARSRSGLRGKGKGEFKGKAKGKGRHSMRVSVGEVLSLITRDSSMALHRLDDASTATTTAGTEATSEDPEGM